MVPALQAKPAKKKAAGKKGKKSQKAAEESEEEEEEQEQQGPAPSSKKVGRLAGAWGIHDVPEKRQSHLVGGARQGASGLKAECS